MSILIVSVTQNEKRWVNVVMGMAVLSAIAMQTIVLSLVSTCSAILGNYSWLSKNLVIVCFDHLLRMRT